jgi:hypothetical protein
LHRKSRNENAQSHTNVQLDFKLLGKGKQDIRQQLDSAYRRNIEQHNEQVRKNRYVLSKTINCIKFCGVFELETDVSLNPGIFRGLISLTAELDATLKDHIEKAQYKYAFYVHCYAHQLNLIMSQAATQK